MNTSATHRHVVGDQQLIDALRGLTADMRERTLESGVRELVKPIKRAAKNYAGRSRETGALQASIDDKVINYPARGKTVGLVGPDKHYYVKGKRVKGTLSKAMHAERRRPSNYAHLVEFGHIAANATANAAAKRMVRWTGKEKKRANEAGESLPSAGRRVKSFVPAKPFLRPAVETTQAEQEAGFYRGLERGWNKAVEKETAAGRHVRG